MSLRGDLSRLAKKERLSLHMPGHKGLRHSWDTTELPGTDSLLEPAGSLRELEGAIARIYGCRRSYLGTNGSTGLLLSAMMKGGRGTRTLLPRSAHLSLYKGLMLMDQEPLYIPVTRDSLGIARPPGAASYEPLLEEADNVVFSSPSYEGFIEDYAHLLPDLKGRLSILDGAHGSHHYYIRESRNAFMDLTVHSFHKTLGAMNQAAVLLSNLEEDLRQEASFFQTSSPSFPILASVEDSLREMMAWKIPEKLRLMENLRQGIRELPGLHILPNEDPLKLILLGPEGWDMRLLGTWLREREGIYMELEEPGYLLGILSLYDSPEGYRHLLRGLKKAVRHFRLSGDPTPLTFHTEALPEMRLLPGEGAFAPRRLASLQEAQGLVAAAIYTPYPPGIPALVPGEVIGEDFLRSLSGREAGYLGGGELLEGRIWVIR